MTGFQSRFLEYDTCLNLFILNTEYISSSYSQLGSFSTIGQKY